MFTEKRQPRGSQTHVGHSWLLQQNSTGRGTHKQKKLIPRSACDWEVGASASREGLLVSFDDPGDDKGAAGEQPGSRQS